MINLLPSEIFFQGRPVAAITEACLEKIQHVDSSVPLSRLLNTVLKFMTDLAEPGEPEGWLCEARLLLGDRVWMERSGGMIDEHGHHGGYWTMFLPEER